MVSLQIIVSYCKEQVTANCADNTLNGFLLLLQTLNINRCNLKTLYSKLILLVKRGTFLRYIL